MIAPGQLARFSRDLGALLALGYPLVEALGRVRLRAQGGLADLLAQLDGRVRQGSSLAGALAGCPVPMTFRRAVEVGESVGDLPSALQQAADLLEAAEWRRLAMQAGLAYPRFLLFLGLGGGALLALLVTSMVQLQGAAHSSLPAITRWAQAVGGWLARPGSLLALATGVVALDCLVTGRWGLDGLRMRLPLLGSWVRRQETVTCLEWLDYLLARRLPLDEALGVCAEAASSPAFGRAVRRLAAEVAAGSSLAEAPSVRVLPALAAWLVGQAERREFPPGHLVRVGRLLQREVDLSYQRGLALVEPLAMLGVGALVGFLILAWFLPLYQAIGMLA